MPCISAAEFRARAAAAAQIETETIRTESVLACIPCGKRFVTQNAYANHTKSRKCRLAVAKYDDNADKEANAARAAEAKAAASGAGPAATTALVPPLPKTMPALGPLDPDFDDGASVASLTAKSKRPEPEPVELDITDCIFCSHSSDTLEDNLKHMAYAHGFFIPDIKYVCDLVGLVLYLQTKVSDYHMCLLCNGRGRGFRSMEAARAHMVDKGHCFVEYEEEGQLELEEFYDFSSSYPDYDPEKAAAAARGEAVDVDGGGAAVAAAGGSGGDDGEWEDIDDEGEVVKGDETEEPDDTEAEMNMRIQKYTATLSALAVAREHRARIEGTDLVLPSGTKVGHRAMKRYYKQRFASEDNRDSVVIQGMVSEYKAIGLHGAASGAATVAERRIRDQAQKLEKNARMRLGMKHNKSYMNRFFVEQNVQ